ncbi:MAG: DUF2085 domain-containing protein [Candidatus Micrarchaeota archaeon]|nr:DUF2085 domain-containing protein [Candidatus Micrarchaeota archaeon]
MSSTTLKSMVDMKKRHLIIYLIIAALLVLNLVIILTPFLLLINNSLGSLFYKSLSPLCHQIDSRSICLDSFLKITDCIENKKFMDTTRSPDGIVIDNDQIKYKFPVCSRDVTIYLFLLIGMIYGIMKFGIDSDKITGFTLLYVSLVPIGIDGILQTLTEFNIILPFIGTYESTNQLRLLTGAIAGFACGMYLIPLLNYYWKWLLKE